jgi:hypothetical protein
MHEPGRREIPGFDVGAAETEAFWRESGPGSRTELRAACNAALDAHDAALVALACWCDEHPGDARQVG